MEQPPETFVHHQATEEQATQLKTEIEAQIPELTVRVARTPAETEALIPAARMLLTFRLPGALLDRAENLALVQALSAGVDSYDLDRLREEGIVLTSASGSHAEPIGEQVLGYMLLFERDLLGGLDRKRRGVWERYSAGELLGKTLGVVGVGAIGTRIAELGRAVGMTVVGTKRDLDDVPEAVDEIFPPEDLHTVLQRSDYVVLSCPLTDATRALIGAEELGVLGTDAVLINVARGGVVDQDALVTALQQRRIRGAALDVFEEEPLPSSSALWDLSNVIVTPHMAGVSPAYHARKARIFVQNYRAFVDGSDDGYVNRVV